MFLYISEVTFDIRISWHFSGEFQKNRRRFCMNVLTCLPNDTITVVDVSRLGKIDLSCQFFNDCNNILTRNFRHAWDDKIFTVRRAGWRCCCSWSGGIGRLGGCQLSNLIGDACFNFIIDLIQDSGLEFLLPRAVTRPDFLHLLSQSLDLQVDIQGNILNLWEGLEVSSCLVTKLKIAQVTKPRFLSIDNEARVECVRYTTTTCMERQFTSRADNCRICIIRYPEDCSIFANLACLPFGPEKALWTERRGASLSGIGRHYNR